MDVGAHSVKLVVSSGPAPVAVPPIKGEPWANAQKQLDDDRVRATGRRTQAVQRRSPANVVISVTPATGTLVAPDATLDGRDLEGPRAGDGPRRDGQTFTQAEGRARGAALQGRRAGTDVFSNDVPRARSSSTVAAGGRRRCRTARPCEVIVSHGPIMVTVPT